jgi:hypothetical protein
MKLDRKAIMFELGYKSVLPEHQFFDIIPLYNMKGNFLGNYPIIVKNNMHWKRIFIKCKKCSKYFHIVSFNCHYRKCK